MHFLFFLIGNFLVVIAAVLLLVQAIRGKSLKLAAISLAAGFVIGLVALMTMPPEEVEKLNETSDKQITVQATQDTDFV